MTPEREEEIRKKITARGFWKLDTTEHTQIIYDLWTALKEVKQDLHRVKITSSVHEGNSDSYFAECERLRNELSDANRTISLLKRKLMMAFLKRL